MQVMVLEEEPRFQAQIAAALMEKGLHVICVDSREAAETFLRLGFIDILVLGERIHGRLSHAVALLAECRNPMVAAILLTDRIGPDLDELFELVPAVYGILGRQVGAAVIARFVLSAAESTASETVRRRLSNRWLAAEAAGDAPVLTDDRVKADGATESFAPAMADTAIADQSLLPQGPTLIAADDPPAPESAKALPVLVLSATAFSAVGTTSPGRPDATKPAPAVVWPTPADDAARGVVPGWLRDRKVPAVAGQAANIAGPTDGVPPVRERRLHLA